MRDTNPAGSNANRPSEDFFACRRGIENFSQDARSKGFRASFDPCVPGRNTGHVQANACCFPDWLERL